MKHLLLIFLLLPLGLASCSNSKSADDPEVTERSPKEIATDSIQAYLKRVMNDPASYQPVAIKDFKVLTERDSLKRIVAYLEYETTSDTYKSIHNVAHEKRMLDAMMQYSSKAQLQEQRAKVKLAQDSVAAHLARMEHYKARISKMKPILEDSTKNKTVIGYSLTHDCRGKNKLGGLILASYDFVLDKKFNVVYAKLQED